MWNLFQVFTASFFVSWPNPVAQRFTTTATLIQKHKSCLTPTILQSHPIFLQLWHHSCLRDNRASLFYSEQMEKQITDPVWFWSQAEPALHSPSHCDMSIITDKYLFPLIAPNRGRSHVGLILAKLFEMGLDVYFLNWILTWIIIKHCCS